MLDFFFIYLKIPDWRPWLIPILKGKKKSHGGLSMRTQKSLKIFQVTNLHLSAWGARPSPKQHISHLKILNIFSPPFVYKTSSHSSNLYLNFFYNYTWNYPGAAAHLNFIIIIFKNDYYFLIQLAKALKKKIRAFSDLLIFFSFSLFLFIEYRLVES